LNVAVRVAFWTGEQVVPQEMLEESVALKLPVDE
jgi:hypothetical protein